MPTNLRDNFSPTDVNSEVMRILHNISLMGKTRDKKILTFLLSHGHISFPVRGDFDKEKMLSSFFEIIDLFEQKYKDNFDIKFYNNEDKNFEPVCVVKYPEFTITNSAKHSHIIRDLLIVHRFSYSNNHLYTSELKGGRLTRTLLELKSCYLQSHLPGINEDTTLEDPFRIENFCTGGGTEVSRMKAEFVAEMPLDQYELFLFCVDSMVTWESTEGGPFRRMADISVSMNNTIVDSSERVEDMVINKIMREKIPLLLDYYVEEDRYRIRINEKSNAFIKNIFMTTVSESSYGQVLCVPSVTYPGNYLQMQTGTKIKKVKRAEFKKVNKEPQYLFWRGVKVFPKVLESHSRDILSLPIEDYIVYPKFLENVLRKLEARIYEKAVVKSTAEAFNSIGNTIGSATPN